MSDTKERLIELGWWTVWWFGVAVTGLSIWELWFGVNWTNAAWGWLAGVAVAGGLLSWATRSEMLQLKWRFSDQIVMAVASWVSVVVLTAIIFTRYRTQQQRRRIEFEQKLKGQTSTDAAA